MKAKSSEVLEKALALILSGEQNFVCAAIQDVETDMRYANNGRDVRTNATKLFQQFMPHTVREDVKTFSNWWPKKDPARIEALEKCIALAKKKGD